MLALETIVAKLIGEAEPQGVQFDPGKTELIHFARQRRPITEGLTVANLAVKPKPLVKWLGVWLDYQLNFKHHVTEKLEQATKAFQGLQRLGNTQHGLPARALRLLYIACISSIVDYGVPLWYKGPGQKNLIYQLQQLQNLALARILGAFKRSPYKALELEAAIPPVEVRLQKACLKYGLRTQTLSETHPIRLAITSTAAPTQLTRLLASLDKAIGKYERIERQDLVWQAPWNKEPKATILISQASKKEAKKQHLQLLEDLTFDNYRAFYTDGSQGTHKGTSTNSCAYYEDSPSRQTEAAKTARVARFWNLGPYIEVADAELIAISKVLDALLLSRTNQPTAYIFVDSQAAIMKIKGPGEISYRIRAQLHLLSQQSIAITVAWVPSHTGIPGNEIADQLAKKGLEASYRGRPYASLSYLNRKIRKVIVQQWQTSWASEEMREETGQRARGLGTQYRRIAQDNLSFSLKANLVKGPRSTQSAYIQLKLGIGYLKSYQKAIKNLPDDRCRCSQRHTTQHLLLRCSRYQGPRKALQKALGPGAQLTLQKLFTTKLGKEALIGFLTSTKICTRSWFLEE
ncbi:hypothetical protein PT974_10011 [Cladobotryum mycophilum]|uniref:RNase H type-1 domain-containing protein n=1 Tax=Cladobotryum mycophilum TaxID=491253 RepID=A0ABR0S8U7_9HYPO